MNPVWDGFLIFFENRFKSGCPFQRSFTYIESEYVKGVSGTWGQVHCPSSVQGGVGRGVKYLVPVEWSILQKDGEMVAVFMTKAAVEAGDSFLEESRKVYRLVTDMMETADVREDGLVFLSYGEIWRSCCERGMFWLHKVGFAVMMDGLFS